MSEKELPAPLTPPDCDLSSMKWFPLKHKRMLKSSWFKRASRDARAISLVFWAVSYDEVPAASLPNDDFELAGYAGFGENVDAWLVHKDSVLNAWVLCSDGRWYHPTLAEVARETWATIEETREFEREKKRRQREKRKTASKNDDVPRGQSELSPGGHEHVSPGEKAPVPTITRQDITGEEKRDSESPPDSVGAAATVKPAKAPAKSKAPTKRAARAARETPIVWDWTPDEIDTAYAVRKGYSPVEARAEGEKFFAYYRAKGTRWVDWRAVWRKWILNNITGGPRGGNGSSASNRVPADDRRKAQHQDRVGDMLAGAMDALDGLRR